MKQPYNATYLILALLWSLGSIVAAESTHGAKETLPKLSAANPAELQTKLLIKLLADLEKGTNAEGKPAHAQSIALALYKIVGKNVIQAAHKLHTTLGSQVAHKYLKTVLTDLFARAKNNSSYAHIPQELARNERFCAHLKQSASGIQARINEQPDPAIPALKDLQRHLHYYTWLEALQNTQKAYCTRPFYTEPFKGLPDNLKTIIWSMIHDNDNQL